MINTSEGVLLRKSGFDLYLDFCEAVESTSKTLRMLEGNGKNWKIKSVFDRVFEFPLDDFKVDHALLEFLCAFSCSNTKNDLEMVKVISDYIPNGQSLIVADARSLKLPVKILLCYMHKLGTLLLPYKFTRPIEKALDAYEAGCYCETLLALRALDDRKATDKRGKNYDPAEKANRRVFQLGAKMVLASTWYTPEDVTREDLFAWRSHNISMKDQGRGNEISPLPLFSLAEQLHKLYPSRMQFDLDEWKKQATKQLGAYGGSIGSLLSDVMKLGLAADDAVDRFKSYVVAKWTALAPDSIDDFQIPQTLFDAGCDVGGAYSFWLSLERDWLEDASYTNDKGARLILGRLNLYLFVYLPLWYKENPKSELPYPDSPNKFHGRVFYNCKGEAENRPFSLTEFLTRLGSKINYGYMNKLKVFFEYLMSQKFNVPGCTGLVQPVYVLPRTKKYREVVKEVLLPDHLLFFVEYAYSIENLFSVLLNSRRLFLKARKLTEKNRQLNMDDLGYVPFIRWRGKIYPIKQLNAALIDCVQVRGREVINPAFIRLILTLMEGGMRTQASQWLDARSYDRHATRPFYHPDQITMLWLNTDKIHSQGMYVLSQVKVILMLDRQVEWRNRLIKLGCKAFTKPILYDGKQTKWGKILPVFSSNPDSGMPISDSKIADMWPVLCLAFQMWMRDGGWQVPDMVKLLPVKKRSANQSGENPFFVCADVAESISEEDVKVIKPDTPKRYYAGDYCPVVLRAVVTPHGLRASFVTAMSTILDIESVTRLTGQTLATVMYYNKGFRPLQKKIGQPVNYIDLIGHLDYEATSSPVLSLPSTLTQAQRLERAKLAGNVDRVAAELGLISINSAQRDDEALNGMQIIARERSLNLGVAHTHICPFNFVCPREILEELGGERHCSRCRLAVFSVFNISAVAAKRHQMAEEQTRLMTQLEHYSKQHSPSSAELRMLETEIKQHSLDLVGWIMIEESLWALIQDIKENKTSQKILVQDAAEVLMQIEQFPVAKGSLAEFAARLSEVKHYPRYSSVTFKADMERASRLLLARQGDLNAAICKPPSFEPHEELLSLIHQAADQPGFDLETFHRLLTGSDTSSWIDLLSQKAPLNLLGSEIRP
ncbi:hypothetical protein [Pseudomonas asiatica]|uniref:Uncharacterized protein n=1 Tax=Pseudomonas asiatica TaxID=2219225 RepID=A0A9X4D224_9PSED|nr:hypothetical protein [Pseudomonas asiatica]MDD2108316.1 hypothetical protein [Pseudomonas asiatica]